MPSNEEYNRLIDKAAALTDQEQGKVTEYEDVIANIYNYQEIISSEDIDTVLKSYETQILNLSTLPENSLTENQKKALERNKEMLNHLEQQKQESLKAEGPLLTREPDHGASARAGFTNGAIIIFIVALVGVILSISLLTLR